MSDSSQPLASSVGKLGDAELSVSSGYLDEIVESETWEKTTGLTKEKVMNMIPPHLKKRIWWKSLAYLIRSCFYCAVCSMVFICLQNAEANTSINVGKQSIPLNFSVRSMLERSSLFNFVYWGIYAVIQGTLLTGIWVIGHECGHGAFSESKLFNDIIGMITHTSLLVPYFAWQFTHGKHHKFTNHLTRGETHVPPSKPTFLNKAAHAVRGLLILEEFVVTPIGVMFTLVLGWPLYLVFNLTGGRTNWKNERLNKKNPISHFISHDSELFPPVWRKRVLASSIAIAFMCGTLCVWAHCYGFGHMLKWYFYPYVVVNGWLVLYTLLHHTHESVPHFGDDSFNWLRGALCTIDRPYPWIIDHVHLHIGSTHVLHHLNSTIPHYNAQAATKILRTNLGALYRYDDRGIIAATWSIFKTCHYVEAVTGLQFYRTYGLRTTDDATKHCQKLDTAKTEKIKEH